MNDVAQQTAGNWLNSSLWVLVVFVGAMVLLGLIIWARRRNQDITPDQHRRTEEATRANYQDPVDTDSLNR